MPEALSQAELFAQAIESRLRDLHVAIPARVERYDLARQTVDVQPVLTRTVPRGEDSPPLVETLPVIQSVPVVFPRGGGFFLSVPIQRGDYVLCVFSERNIGAWRANGGASVNPGDQRLHPLDGAIAIPGVFPSADALQSAHASGLAFGKDGGLVVTCTDTQMQVGGSSDAAALASQVAALRNAVATHTHVETGGTTNAPTFVSALPSSGAFASSKLKVGG